MTAATPPARLQVLGATLAYDGRVVSRDLTVAIPDGSFTAIVGPNACGKSTLLRALARILTPKAGSVTLDGVPLDRIPAREVARAIGLLPQNPLAPEGILVADLVARGRYPHQTLLRQWTRKDAEAVARALQATRIEELADRRVSDLSGGQRQRVWIAMVLAQETPILLLDEPTTWLDIAHQVEVMELLARQVREEGRTIIAVLHELNHAFRHATHVLAMRGGRVVAQGAPGNIVTAGLIEALYDLPCVIAPDPLTGAPMVIPRPAA